MLIKNILIYMAALGMFTNQLLGLWPYRLNYRKLLITSAWYMRLYSLGTFGIALVCCVSNYTASLINENEWKRSQTFATTNQIFTLIMAIVIIVTFTALQFNHTRIERLFPVAIRLLAEVNKLNDRLGYYGILIRFAVKIVIVDCAIIFTAVSHSSAPDRWQTYFFSIIPNMMIAFIPNLFLVAMQTLCYYFTVINKRMERIMLATKELIDACVNDMGKRIEINSKVTMSHVSMKRFCELSDQIDEIAILHLEMCRTTRTVSRLWSLQLLTWTAYSVVTFIVKLFKEYIAIASTINNAAIEFDMHRFANNMISLVAIFIGLVFLANIASTTMKEAHKTGEILHFIYLNNFVDIRFKRSVSIL